MFEKKILDRSVDEYADFFLPFCPSNGLLLDVGCGDGSITVGLAEHCADVLGVDIEDHFEQARQYLDAGDIRSVAFQTGSAYQLPADDERIDACFYHSILEALDKPALALAEAYRVMKSGAWIGVASVEYQGLILNGGNTELLQKFYALRKSLWRAEGVGDPYFGRTLRGLLLSAGFSEVTASTKAVSHGTCEQIESFGQARRDECSHPFYREKGVALGFTDDEALDRMAAAWDEWSRAKEAYCSFSFCRAVGQKPKP